MPSWKISTWYIVKELPQRFNVLDKELANLAFKSLIMFMTGRSTHPYIKMRKNTPTKLGPDVYMGV